MDIISYLLGKKAGGGGNTEAAYEAGKKAQYDAFWDSFQNYGARTIYYHGFCDWEDSSFYPKYDLKPTQMTSMFRLYGEVNAKTDLTERLKECGVTLDTSNCSTFEQAFLYAYITRIPTIDTRGATKLFKLFQNAYVITVDKVILKSDGSQVLDRTFDEAMELVNLTIEGTIGQNGVNVQWSPLSHDSLMSILNALKDYSKDTSGTEWKITIGSKNYAKLTAEEIVFAEMKGWNIE